MEGFIKLHRNILKWEWGDDPNTFSVFVHLLLMANHEPNRWRGVDIGRGQVITSLAKLAKACGISVQNLRTCLSRLKSTHEITQTSTSKYSVITICKYDIYQSQPTSDQHESQHESQQSINKQSTTNKNEKKKKKNLKENTLKEKSEEELVFERMMQEAFPRVMSMKKPLTLKQYKVIADEYGSEVVKHKLEAMENWTRLSKNHSANLTLQDWLRRDNK